MKKKIPGILFGLMFLIGFGVLVYPTVADQWNTYRQNRLISSYEDTVEEMEPEDFTREWEAARSFNATIPQNNIYGDVFGEDGKEAENTAYWQVLNIAGDGVMGYLSIPKIDVKLSIYHGTSDEVLQTGIGHLDGRALPIGGESTHSVLAAHRGLPSARLFTDVDQLQEGDKFYIHVLDEVLAYQVDQILDMVDKRRKRLCNLIYLYSIRRQFPPAVSPGRESAVQRGGRCGTYGSRIHAAVHTGLLYVVSDSGSCGDFPCHPAFAVFDETETAGKGKEAGVTGSERSKKRSEEGND